LICNLQAQIIIIRKWNSLSADRISPNAPSELIELGRRFALETIYEVGSRDAVDGIGLAETLKATELHVFEPNPPSFAVCRKNVASAPLPFRVFLNETALSDVRGAIPFFAVDTERSVTPVAGGNPGASSIFVFNDEYPYERIIQNEISVRSETMDSYCTAHAAPDLLWLDAQGAELKIFEGAARTLEKVKIIFTEVSFRPDLPQPAPVLGY
jgi:FkbM family methyltransferase